MLLYTVKNKSYTRTLRRQRFSLPSPPASRAGSFRRNWDVLLLYRRKNSKRRVNPSGARWTNGFAELAAMTFTFPQSNFNGPDQKVHPFQKSLGCMRWLVQNLTEPGDLVADPFAGSGTTGIAAVQLVAGRT